jgi:hypothetical protein
VRLPAALLCGCLAFVGVPALGDDLYHVSDAELAEELLARMTDVDRTAERVALLDLEELELAAELENSRTDARELDERLVRRVGLLYRISEGGRGLRYLLASGSATEFLKRLRMLRHLVLEGLEERRQAGLRVAEAEGRIESVRQERQQARAMLQQLEAARVEILDEQTRRAVRPRRKALR